MVVLILSATLKFSLLSLCILYYSIVVCRDIFIYAFSVMGLVFFAAINVWFDSWWQVVFSIGLGTVFGVVSYIVFDLPSFIVRRHPSETAKLHVQRFNRNIIFAIELILLSATFLLIEHEIAETNRFPIGIVMTFIFLVPWFLFVLLVEWIESAMYRTYFFIVVTFTILLLAHWKIYVSLYLVSSVACVAAFLVWGAVSIVIAVSSSSSSKSAVRRRSPEIKE